MKSAVLYVYYCAPRTCARRLRLMRSISPDASFYGICTEQADRQSKFDRVADELDDAWAFPFVNPKWHWHNLDKVVCKWFVERGVDLEFDRLLVLDWDALLLSPVSTWTSSVNDGNAKFINVWANTRPEENHWTQPTNPDFISFCSQYQARHGAAPQFHNAFLFAYVVPRQALEDCAGELLTYPGYCEYRLPTLLHGRGYKLENLPRPDDWWDLANVNGRSISRRSIHRELSRPDGFRLFHPVYEPYLNAELKLSPVEWIAEGCLYRTMSRSFKETVKRYLLPART